MYSAGGTTSMSVVPGIWAINNSLSDREMKFVASVRCVRQFSTQNITYQFFAGVSDPFPPT